MVVTKTHQAQAQQDESVADNFSNNINLEAGCLNKSSKGVLLPMMEEGTRFIR